MSKHDCILKPSPVCPSCGAEQTDVWEISFNLDEEAEICCGTCGEMFNCRRVVQVSYISFEVGDWT